MRRVLTATLIVVAAGTIGMRGDDTAARWWSHVEALANDGMEGRNTSVNLEGALAVYFSSTPKSLPGPLQVHFGSAGERWKRYKAAGAIGTISIANPKRMDVPWARSTLARLQPAMSLADATLDDAAGRQLSITMNPAHADTLFAGSGQTFAEQLALVDAGKPVPGFALPGRLKAAVTVERALLQKVFT